jgi:multidrug efflux pump subunit AcrA (membrane-fusion protein)
VSDTRPILDLLCYSNMSRFTRVVFAHKIISVIALASAVFGGYQGYKFFFGTAAAAPRYALAAISRGTLVTSVSGTGQISASNQFDVKSNASGNVISLGVQEGRRAGAGAVIAQLDPTDAQKAVRDAEVNLQSAQLSLQQVKLSSANSAKLTGDAFTSISNAFLSLPQIVSDAQQIIASNDLNPQNQANNDYYKNFVGQNDDKNFSKISLLVDTRRREKITTTR